MKRIVLLKSNARNKGGLEKAASRIGSAFVQQGAEVTILTTGNSSSSDGQIQVVSTPVIPWPAFLRMEQFDRFTQSWLRRKPADLVFGMDRNRVQTHIRAGNGVHRAYLESRIHVEGRLKYWSCLFNPMHQKILELEQAAFEYPGLQKLFTNSHMVKNQILERYRVDPQKIQVVHNGVEWHEMQQDFDTWSEKRKELFKHWGLPTNRFHLLFVGNGYLRKGLGQLLEAIAALKEPNLFLSVVGKDSNQPLFEAKACKLGIQKQVRFFGQQESIRPFYLMSDALAIPSFYDPFANVTIEALAMGLFVCSSKCNGGIEILHPDCGAVIEDLLSIESIQAALRIALQHPKTLESALRARKSVEHLDFSHQMDLLIESCL